MSGQSSWEGKSKGGLTGQKIFVFLLKIGGLPATYFLLRFVAFYFFLFAKSGKPAYQFFRKRIGYSKIKSLIAVYQNYFIFGQVLIDKVALLSGTKNKFTFDHEGHEENLDYLKTLGKGSILLSAHVGNWEIAGQMLESTQVNFNILMYDNEMAQMKSYMDQVMKKKNFKVISIRDGDMSHLIELHKAFSNNEWVVMHGDRFRPGVQTIEKEFLGKKAKFPKGPFTMAAKFGVPITMVFAVKERKHHYHFFAFKPIEVKRARTEEQLEKMIEEASTQYVQTVEHMVKKYPTQWFNFYYFWET